jgi:hypothetical protein
LSFCIHYVADLSIDFASIALKVFGRMALLVNLDLVGNDHLYAVVSLSSDQLVLIIASFANNSAAIE